jgi:hypothetical protein
MRLKNLFLVVCAAFLLITSQQVLADDDDDDDDRSSSFSSSSSSPFWEQQQLIYILNEYWRSAMHLYELQQAMDDAKKKGDHRALRDARKAFRGFENIFKQIAKAYKGSKRGNIIWVPVPGWNPWSPYGWGRPGQGGECTRDPGPCLKCEDGYIVADDSDNPKKRCYQCSGGVAVQANGQPCNDYNPWTVNDVCQQGRCKGYPGPNPSPSLPF